MSTLQIHSRVFGVQIPRGFRAYPCVTTTNLEFKRCDISTTIHRRGSIIQAPKSWSARRASAWTRRQAVSAERGTMGRPVPPVETLKAVLFDVDGTLADSDPIHWLAFRQMLVEEGYNGGEPITEEFFSKNISGNFNPDIGAFLFPDWEESRQAKWLEDKEALFRKMAAEKLNPTPGLDAFAKWVKSKKLKRAAVTNAPRPNAEQMIAAVGLSDFFDFLVIGDECKRGKPFPDPYLRGLELLGIPANKCLVFEDSPSGIKAAVAAELAVVGVISANPESDLINAGAAMAIHGFNDPKLWNALGEPSPA